MLPVAPMVAPATGTMHQKHTVQQAVVQKVASAGSISSTSSFSHAKVRSYPPPYPLSVAKLIAAVITLSFTGITLSFTSLTLSWFYENSCG